MNLSKPLHVASRFLYLMFLQFRTHLPRQKCISFKAPSDTHHCGIGEIFIINLDRQPDRLAKVLNELSCILDADGKPLSVRTIRHPACDALTNTQKLFDNGEIDPYYTLSDQLFVEPQPHALPDEFDLMRPIKMSPAEVAVARSHIEVWKIIAQSDSPYTLILEDDVIFERGFGRVLDQAWQEMRDTDQADPSFDVLYMSYKEARYGAPKELISKNVFRPERGIWYLSGYVLSKKGAQKLIKLLPCRGPIDLWINHKFQDMNVRGLRRSVINQRLDTPSTNSYSILPALSRIGVLNGSDASLFHQRPTHTPVFALGASCSGLSSLAMALSMLGYRCCSDLDQIPKNEFENLMSDRQPRIFNAYVNIFSLRPHVRLLMQRYPHAKFIVIDETDEKADYFSDVDPDVLKGNNIVRLHGKDANSWRVLCEHLRLSPPTALYPTVNDIGQRKYEREELYKPTIHSKIMRHDQSPWVVPQADWTGIKMSTAVRFEPTLSRVSFEDNLSDVPSERWLLRNDTFPGNLGLFRPDNVISQSGGGLSFIIKQQFLGVRNLSAAAISSRKSFLYGRFEATLQATNVSGLVTGFFLHRDSPRQEIDIEIRGNRPNQLLVNVFYNPGAEGAKFDYGYRGTPVEIALGFDASKAFHRYAIEWDSCEIRWFVDGELVHRRVSWNPTPIPHLPMILHINAWPTRSRELAGRLMLSALPTSTKVRRVIVDATSPEILSKVDALEECIEEDIIDAGAM